MKAKDYFEKHGANYGAVCFDMFVESGELIKARHATSNIALVGIVKELDLKWRAYVRLVNISELRKDGFIRFVLTKVPEIVPYFPGVEIPTPPRE